MARRAQALVKKELLAWARQSARLQAEEAAQKIGITTTKLLLWEDGAERPSIPQLRKLASAYKRPLAVFFLPAPPNELGFDAMKDFRRLELAGGHEMSPSLAIEIREARDRQRVAKELLAVVGGTEAALPSEIAVNDDAEKKGEELRAALDVSLAAQLAWKDSYDGLRAWRQAVERLGVLVFQTSDVDVLEMRGFSIADDQVPVIVVNAKDAPTARSFTLIHELTHLLLHNAGMCDLAEDSTRPHHEDAVEVFCNAVAASVLVPLADFRTKAGALGRGEPGDEAIIGMARQYRVSYEVILRRLLTLGRVSAETYRRRREAYNARPRPKRDEEIRVPYHRIILRDNGAAYVGLVLGAYHQDAITVSDVADYLGMKLRHLPKLESELYRMA